MPHLNFGIASLLQFTGCVNLEGCENHEGNIVVCPPSLKKLGDDAFAGCAKIDFVHLKMTERTIGKNCFAGCTALLGESAGTWNEDEVMIDAPGYDEEKTFELLDNTDQIYTKITTKNIREAVKMWFLRPSKALKKYGHIREWDVSHVEDMSYLFSCVRKNKKRVGDITADEDFAGLINTDITGYDVSKAKKKKRVKEGGGDEDIVEDNNDKDNDINWTVQKKEVYYNNEQVIYEALKDWNCKNVKKCTGIFKVRSYESRENSHISTTRSGDLLFGNALLVTGR